MHTHIYIYKIYIQRIYIQRNRGFPEGVETQGSCPQRSSSLASGKKRKFFPISDNKGYKALTPPARVEMKLGRLFPAEGLFHIKASLAELHLSWVPCKGSSWKAALP